ncbi:unnamed protein product, partial [Discosporangium mesarthrocarpum]
MQGSQGSLPRRPSSDCGGSVVDVRRPRSRRGFAAGYGRGDAPQVYLKQGIVDTSEESRSISDCRQLSAWLAGGDFNPEGQPNPEVWVALISKQALKHLHGLHRRGVIHGIVHPKMMLLTKDGELLTIYRNSDEGDDGGWRGTVEPELSFCPPDRLLGGLATKEGDMWSLGLTLAAFAIGGNPLHPGTTLGEAVALARGVALKTIRKGVEMEIDEALLDFLRILLSEDPADRPPARAMLEHPFLQR